MLSNSTIESNITQFNGTAFSWLGGFGMMFSSCNASFYVMDFSANIVFILNENWSFLSFKTFTYPAYMITVGKSLYLTGESNLWKLDLNLNVLIQYTETVTVWYRGVYFNSTNRFLYVAPFALTVIHVFDLNPTLSHSFSI